MSVLRAESRKSDAPLKVSNSMSQFESQSVGGNHVHDVGESSDKADERTHLARRQRGEQKMSTDDRTCSLVAVVSCQSNTVITHSRRFPCWVPHAQNDR